MARPFVRFYDTYGAQLTRGYARAEAMTALAMVVDSDRHRLVAAFSRPFGSKSDLYVVTYNAAEVGDVVVFFERLVDAVTAHRDASAGDLPSYLADVRVAQVEQDVLTRLEAVDHEREQLLDQAEQVARWRHLISGTQGDPLVRLIVDALNVVFGRTELRAEQRTERSLEDFWITSPVGDVAIGEAKGVSGNVTRQYVNQVDNNREANDLPAMFPGVAVINTFRQQGLAERRQEVSPDVRALARSQNVLVLTTFGLFELLGRALDGDADVGELLVAHLHGGGDGCASMQGQRRSS